MTISVRVIEWPNRVGPLSRWAGECFKDCGCNVEVTNDWENTGGVDLVYTPVPGLKETKDTSLVTSLEGYGAGAFMPSSDNPSPKLLETFENSDKVLLADPNLYLQLKRCGIDKPSIMLPNTAPDITITPKDTLEFRVFAPAGCWEIKKPERVIKAAKIVEKVEPDIKFVMTTGSADGVWRCPLDWLELDNMEFLPSLPYEEMLKEYSKASVVAPFSAAEILPWTVFESFLAGKPTIVDVIGKVQSVHREHIKEMVSWFGTPSNIFNERWEDTYMSGDGDHFLHASGPEELARHIIDLYRDEKKRLELGNNALEWVDAYDWKPKDKGRKILDLVGIK